MPRSVLLGRPWPVPGEPLFLPEDTAVAIALHEQEAAEEADQCPLCGLPKEMCRAKDNQFAFRVSWEQCHATYALLAAQGVDADEVARRSQQWSAQLRH